MCQRRIVRPLGLLYCIVFLVCRNDEPCTRAYHSSDHIVCLGQKYQSIESIRLITGTILNVVSEVDRDNTLGAVPVYNPQDAPACTPSRPHNLFRTLKVGTPA